MQNWFFISQKGERFPFNPQGQQQSGPLPRLIFDGRFDPDKIDRNITGLWRYHQVLPLENLHNRISLNEGLTPLIHDKFRNKQLSLKLDYLFPGASFKDRGATVLISKLKEWGIRSLVEDSSGNAGASIASYAARAGMETHLFVARSTREAKKLHIRSMGAVLHEIEGDRQAVADAAIHFAHKHYDASHVRNPLFIHGTKTFAYELWEQCAGALPAHIFFPTGNGSLLLGAFTGFRELKMAGCIAEIPTLHAVQSAHCPSLGPELFTPTPCITDGIAVAAPARKKEMLEAMLSTKGNLWFADNREVMEAHDMLCSRGIYVEPTSAAALAGCLKAGIPAGCLVVLTGHGLKWNGSRLP